MKQNICVIGCGWLGFPLAKSLIYKGYKVKGTTTSAGKISKLNTCKIESYLVKVSSEGIIGPIEQCLADCDILILNIPPGLRKNPDANHVKEMKNLVPYVEASSVSKVLYISSTSVYKDAESFPTITENSPTSDEDHQLLQVEALFQNHLNFKTTILRFSGLFGEDRHPATFLAGRHNVKNPDAPVNLIHRKDSIAIIERIIALDVWNETFNASTSPHPTKQDYYTSVCASKHLARPVFDNSKKSKGKLIDSSKLARVLNYEFKIKL